MTVVTILKNTAWILSFLFTLYVAYYFIFVSFSLRRKKQYGKHAAAHRFAVVIAARNEECVIGNLVDSLMAQSYPRNLYDVIVVPNNCTDHTKQAAEAAGALTYDCKLAVKSKGDALTQVFDKLMADGVYDAFCVFDADNLVHPDFLAEMNNALCEGATLAQGYRDSKNPYDTAISGSYSIYYWMINRLYNHTRGSLGLSAIINGSGFMVRADLLAAMGGWHTVTMTEDIEFTTQAILHGERAAWVPDAIIYDEQPLTFAQSWKQRKRWATGQLQGFEHYFIPLLRRAIKKRDFNCVDQMVFFLTPIMQMVYLASLVLGLVLNVCLIKYNFFPQTELYYRMFVSLNFSYITTAAMAVFTLLIERKGGIRMLKSILYYWVFILSWVPINLICCFKKCTVWDEIKHTRSVTMSDLKRKMLKAS